MTSVVTETGASSVHVAWRSRLCIVALLTMEALALFVLGSLLASTGDAAGPSLLTLLVSAFAGLGLTRLLRQFDFSPRVLVSVGVCISVVGLWFLCSLQYAGQPADITPLSLLLSDPARLLNRNTPVVFGTLVVGLAWIRGSLIATRDEITHRGVLASLTIGLGIVVIGLSFGRAAIASRAIDAAALPFFVSGLLALAVVQLSQSQHIQGDSWRGPWVLALLGTVGVLALLGASFGLLPLDALNILLAPVGLVLLTLIDLLLYILVLPLVIVFNWVLTRLLGGRLHPLDVNFQAFQQVNRQIQRGGHPSGLALLLINIGHVLLVLLIAAAVAGILLWVFRRVERELGAELTDREPVEAEISLVADIRELLSLLRRRMHRPAGPSDPDLSPRLLALRRLYLGLLKRGTEHGIVRPPAATPREFAPVLEEHLTSGVAADLSTRFAMGRYGLVEPSETELDKLERELRRVR